MHDQAIVFWTAYACTSLIPRVQYFLHMLHCIVLPPYIPPYHIVHYFLHTTLPPYFSDVLPPQKITFDLKQPSTSLSLKSDGSMVAVAGRKCTFFSDGDIVGSWIPTCRNGMCIRCTNLFPAYSLTRMHQ